MLKFTSTLTLLALTSLAHAQSPTFAAAVNYATGSNSIYNLAVADLNGDGKPDVVTANGSTDNVGLLLGTSNGTLQPVVTYTCGPSSAPTDVRLVDVNNDGKLDVLTCNSSISTLGVLLGNGDGTFQAVTSYAGQASGLPTAITVADVNGDSRPDVLTANYGNATAGVLLATSTGALSAMTAYPTTSNSSPNDVVVADLTNDGRADLLLTTATSLGAFVLLAGNGNGTFQAPVTYSTGSSSGGRSSGIALADLNGDGKLDVLMTNTNNLLSVLLNTTLLPTRSTLPGATANLWPNPTMGGATLALTGLPAAVTQVQATLFDATGRAVARQQLAIAQGAAHAKVPTAELAVGLYVLRLLAIDAQGAAVGTLPVQHLSLK